MKATISHAPRLSGLAAVFFALAFAMAPETRATNTYVVPPGTPGAAPDGVYAAWSTAATNIQDAIDAINTNGGNVVYISNGVYMLPDELVVAKGIVLRSWSNGVTAPESTIINGNNYEGKPVTNRVMTLDNASAVVDGVTICGGMLSNIAAGAGIFIDDSGMITNCIITGNSNLNSVRDGGGIAMSDGAHAGIITHCSIVSNISAGQGGGMLLRANNFGVVEHCRIEWNQSLLNDSQSVRGGGGIMLLGIGTNFVVRNCRVAHNYAYQSGGGINVYNSGIIENCVIISNHQQRSTNRGGSGVFARNGTNCILRNCLIAYNTNAANRCAVYFPNGGNMYNCTIVSNSAGGIYIGDGGGAINLINTIIYHNSPQDFLTTNNVIASNCMSSVAFPGADNITNAPVYADSDFRLAGVSPGIDAGMHQAWMDAPDAADLDGRRRVDAFRNIVDIGCYEYLQHGSMFRFK